MILYCWMIDGSHQTFSGPYAEHDAKAEAQRVGGTCKAFPVYRRWPLCFDNYDAEDDGK